MRRPLRFLLLVIPLLFLGGILGLEYVNRVVIPQKIRQWTDSVSQALGREVTIGRVRIHPWHGILLEKIRLGEDRRYGKGLFLEADQVSSAILVLPLLQKRHLILPTLRIVRPKGRLLQDPEGLWNIQSLELKTPSYVQGEAPVQILIPRILLIDGEFDLVSQKSAFPLRLHFRNLNSQLGLTYPTEIRWSLTTRVASSSPSDLLLEGEVSLEGEVAKAPGSSPLVKTSLKTQGLSFKIRKSSGEWWQGHGDLQGSIQGKLIPGRSDLPFSDLNSLIQVNKVSIGPLPYVAELKEITGQLTIGPQGIQAEKLTAYLPGGQPLTLSGSLANNEKGSVSLEIKTDLSLDQLTFLPLEIQAITHALKLSGQAQLHGKAQGTLKPQFTLEPVLTATIRNASLQLPMGDPIQRAKGILRWQTDLLTVTQFSGTLRQQPFQLEGTLVNFARPEIDARFSWDLFSAEAKLAIDGKRIEVNSFTGKLGNGTYRVFGEITLHPDLPSHLYGETTLPLEELPQLLPETPGWIKDLAPEGSVFTRWLLQGPLNRPSEWDLSVKASSPLLNLLPAQGAPRKIPLEQVSLELHQEKGQIELKPSKAGLAKGELHISGGWSLKEKANPWDLEVSAFALQLEGLKETFQWKTQDLSGQLFLHWKGQGRGSELSAIEGKGTVQIQGGRILEVPFLGRLADLLELPTLRRIAFESAEGPFSIQEGTIRTEGLEIRSPSAFLAVQGKGGFLQGLDSPVEIQILPALGPGLLPEESRSRLGKVILKGTSTLVGEIRVTGTWKEPKTAFVPKPLTQILNEQLFNLQDLLKEIF